MARTIIKPFHNWLMTEIGEKMLNTISQYSSLSIGMSETSLNVYFQGCKNLIIPSEISSNEDVQLIPLSKAYYEKRDESCLEQIINTGVTLLNLEDYLDRVIGFLSRRDNKRQEEAIRQEISYVNNRSRVANDTDYFIVDQEYGIHTHKTSKFDLVAIKWPSTQSSRKNFALADTEIVVFELKFGLGAVGGTSRVSNPKADLKCHIEDFNSLIADKDKCLSFKKDIVNMFVQQTSLTGFYNPRIKGLKNVAKLLGTSEPDKIASKIKVRFGFIMADYKGASSRLAEQLKSFTDDFIFATSSYMGYGLYEDYMITRIQLENLLQ